MEFVLLFYIDERDFDGVTPEENAKLQAACAREDEELQQQGKLVAARALRPTSEAVTVRIRGSKISRTDGPFAETKEHLGGYYLMDCADLDEAIKWAAQIPGAKYGTVELRPVVVFG